MVTTPHTPDEESTPAYIAASTGDLEALKHILRAEGYLDENNLLVRDRKDEAIAFLTERGANAIHIATRNGHMQTALWLSQQFGCLLEVVDADSGEKKNCLHIAAENGHLELLEYFLRLPVDYYDVTLNLYQSLYSMGLSNFYISEVTEHATAFLSSDYLPYLLGNIVENEHNEIIKWLANRIASNKDDEENINCEIHLLQAICLYGKLENLIETLETLGFLDESKRIHITKRDDFHVTLNAFENIGHVLYLLKDQPTTSRTREMITWLESSLPDTPLEYLSLTGATRLLLNYRLSNVKQILDKIGLLDSEGNIYERYKKGFTDLIQSEYEVHELELDSEYSYPILFRLHQESSTEHQKETAFWLEKNLGTWGWTHATELPLSFIAKHFELEKLEEVLDKEKFLNVMGGIDESRLDEVQDIFSKNAFAPRQHILHYFFTNPSGDFPEEKVRWLVSKLGLAQTNLSGESSLFVAIFNLNLEQIQIVFESAGLLTPQGSIKFHELQPVNQLLTHRHGDHVLHYIFKRLSILGSKSDPQISYSTHKEKLLWLSKNLGTSHRINMSPTKASVFQIAIEKMSIEEVKEFVIHLGYADTDGNILKSQRQLIHNLLFCGDHFFHDMLEDSHYYNVKYKEIHQYQGNYVYEMIKFFGIEYTPRILDAGHPVYPRHFISNLFFSHQKGFPDPYFSTQNRFPLALGFLRDIGYLDEDFNILDDKKEYFENQITQLVEELNRTRTLHPSITLWLSKQVFLKKLLPEVFPVDSLKTAPSQLTRLAHLQIISEQNALLRPVLEDESFFFGDSNVFGEVDCLKEMEELPLDEFERRGWALVNSGFPAIKFKEFTLTDEQLRTDFGKWLTQLPDEFSSTLTEQFSQQMKLACVIKKVTLLDYFIDNLDGNAIVRLVDRGDDVPFPTVALTECTDLSPAAPKYEDDVRNHLILNSICCHYLQRIFKELSIEEPSPRLLKELLHKLTITQSKWPNIHEVQFFPKIKELIAKIQTLLQTADFAEELTLPWLISTFPFFLPGAAPLLFETTEPVAPSSEAPSSEARRFEDLSPEASIPLTIPLITAHELEYVTSLLELFVNHPSQIGDGFLKKIPLTPSSFDMRSIYRFIMSSIEDPRDLQQHNLRSAFLQILPLFIERVLLVGRVYSAVPIAPSQEAHSSGGEKRAREESGASDESDTDASPGVKPKRSRAFGTEEFDDREPDEPPTGDSQARSRKRGREGSDVPDESGIEARPGVRPKRSRNGKVGGRKRARGRRDDSGTLSESVLESASVGVHAKKPKHSEETRPDPLTQKSLLNQVSLKLIALTIKLLLEGRPSASAKPSSTDHEFLEWDTPHGLQPIPPIHFSFDVSVGPSELDYFALQLQENQSLTHSIFLLFPLLVDAGYVPVPEAMRKEFNLADKTQLQWLIDCVPHILSRTLDDLAVEQPSDAPEPHISSAESSQESGRASESEMAQRSGSSIEHDVTGAGAAAGPGIRYRRRPGSS